MIKKELEKPNCGPFQGVGKIWSDDRTEAYIGDCNKIISNKIVSQAHPHSKTFDFEGNCCEYLYLISWSNDRGENGLLAEIQGDAKILSGHSDWEVFATGINKNIGSGTTNSVSVAEIDKQLKRACKIGWKKPFIGQKNNGTSAANRKPFHFVNGISTSAQFMWHNSGKDTGALYPSSPYVPFNGYNHEEFLIFRIPLKTLFLKRCSKCECEACDCGCSNQCDGCNENAKEQDKSLVQKADKKHNTIANDASCTKHPFEKMECETVIKSSANISPCFYFHWGDSKKDVIENHDTETVYITACNPYSDIEFRGLRITKVNLVPTPSHPHQARIIPDSFINYDCLSPCTCRTREFVLITRDELNNYHGNKKVSIEYCWDEIIIKKNNSYGTAAFDIEIIQDEE